MNTRPHRVKIIKKKQHRRQKSTASPTDSSSIFLLFHFMSHTLPSMGFRIFTYVPKHLPTINPKTSKVWINSHHQAPLRGQAQAPISAKKWSKCWSFPIFPDFTYVILQFLQKSWGGSMTMAKSEHEWSWSSNFWPQKAVRPQDRHSNGGETIFLGSQEVHHFVHTDFTQWFSELFPTKKPSIWTLPRCVCLCFPCWLKIHTRSYMSIN